MNPFSSITFLFLNTSTATGVVYSVPAHAPYDYIALIDLVKNKKVIEKFNLDQREIELIYPIQIIELKGLGDFPAKVYCEKYDVETQNDTKKLDLATKENYKDEFYGGILNEKCFKYKGMKVNEAAKQVSKDLINENKADKLYIPVTKDLFCRCGEEVIVSILKNQWFLNFQAGDWKEKAFKCLKNMNITPNKYRLNFEKVFNWLEKRPCARKRGLGTKLPFNKEWIIESLSDSTIYMAFYTVSHKIRQFNIKPEQLTHEFFDFIFLEKGEPKSLSETIKIDEHVIKELQEEFLYWYPVDHRHTAIMHISNHLSFYIFHHVAIFPEKDWPKTLTLIEPLIIEGQKMGKSKGNVISLTEIQQNYSADIFRFYISHGADFSVYMDFRVREINSVKNHIAKFYKFMNDLIFQTKSTLEDFKVVKSQYSKVVLSKICRKFVEAERSLNEFNIRRYLQISFYEIFNIIQDFSQYTEDKNDFLTIFKLIYIDWLKILSLTIPHLCEELWEVSGKNGFISNQIWSDFKKDYIDDEIELEFRYIENVVEDILNIKKLLKTQKMNKIYLYTANKWMYDVLDIIKLQKDNFDLIIADLKKDQNLMRKKQLIPYVKTQLKERIWEKEIAEVEEIKLLDQFKSYIEKRVKCTIMINFKFDPKKKSHVAKPFKPGLFIDS